MIAMNMDGSRGEPADDVAKAYVAVVEGDQTGQVVDPGSKDHDALFGF